MLILSVIIICHLKLNEMKKEHGGSNIMSIFIYVEDIDICFVMNYLL